MKVTKEIIRSINEITDSVEMLHEKPNRGMSVFTIILIGLLVTALTWCCIGKIDYYVKANGAVRPSENISTVSSLMTGKIAELCISEGDSVKKGDLLFKIDTTELEQSKSAYEKEKSRLEADIANLKKYEQSINNGENLFDKNNDSESRYYYKYEKYLSDADSLLEQYSNNGINTDKSTGEAAISVSSIKEQLAKNEHELKELEQLKQSVNSNENRFEDTSSVYASKYEDYLAAVQVYEHSIATKKDTFDKSKSLYEAGGMSKYDYDTLQAEVKSAELELEKYKQEFLLSVEQNITSLNKSTDELNVSLKNNSQAYSAYSKLSNDAKLAVDKLRLETLTGISDQIVSQQASIDSIDKELAAIAVNMKNAEVIAPINGTINMYADVNDSDFVQSGQNIATVVPDSDGEFKLTAYISGSDIKDVSVGQHVKLRFAALPYEEYGEFAGTIKNISTDVRTNETKGSYYVAEISIDDTDTMEYDLVSGMECEARVVTKQRKIIYWLLEKLDFID